MPTRLLTPRPPLSGSLPVLLLLGCTRGPTPLDSAGGEYSHAPPDSGRADDTAETGAPEVIEVLGLTCSLPSADAVRAIDPATLPAGASPCREPELVRVDWLADGDTLHIRRQRDGGEEDVRVIGVDTPEVWGQVECYGPEASRFGDAALDDRLIWLTFDGDCIDPYARTLAYVHLSAAPDCFYERLLLRGGYADTLTFQETSTFAEQFDADEAAARAAGVGMWGECAR